MNRLTKIYLTGLILILPLLRLSWFNEAYEQPKVLLLICVTFMYLGLSGGVIVSERSNNVKISITTYLLIALVGWMGITNLLGVDVENSLFGQYYRYQGLVTQITLMALAIGFSRIKQGMIYANKIAVASGLINGGYVLKQALFDGMARPVANFGNPNFAGDWLAFMAIIGLEALRPRWLKISYLTMMTIAIALTGSRSAILALGIMLMVSYWPKIINKRNLLLVVFGLVGVVAIYVAVAKSRPESSFDRREVIWQRAIEAVGKRPVFGWGLENFEKAFNSTLKSDDFDWKNVRVDKAHNEILEITVAGGLVGLGLYLGLIGVVGYKLREDRKMLAIWIGYLIMSCLTVVNITSQIMFYWAVGMAMRSGNQN